MEHDPKLEKRYRSHSYWLDSVPDSLAPRPALGQDIQCDIGIIGAGYTGLWTAWYLSQHAPDANIVVIEADIAGFGASGRNGGWCSSYLSHLEGRMDDPVDGAAAKDLQRLMFDAVVEVGRVCDKTDIDCHFAHQGHVSVATQPAQLTRDQEHVRYMHQMGFSEADFLPLSVEEVRSRVNIDGALGGHFMPHCAAIHPARLARGLAQAVEQRGVTIFEQTAVRRFGENLIESDSARVRADNIILATEGFSGSFPGMKRKLMPFHSNMIATEPLTDQEIEETGLNGRFNWNNGKHMVTYGQLTADRRIAFGHRGGYMFGGGLRLEYSDDDSVFTLIRNELTRMFPALKGKRVTHAWGGAMGVSRSLHPAVCFDQDSRVGWAGGYFGDGVGAANLAGRTMADLVLARDTQRASALWVNPPRERALTSRLWEPEPLRWLGVQARAKSMMLADWAERKNNVLVRPLNWWLDNVMP